MTEKLKSISKGRRGELFREVLAEVIGQVADVRTALNVKPEIQNEVRLGVIQVLEELQEDSRAAGYELDGVDPNEHV